MIFTIADIIVCGLGVVLCTIFEFWYAVKIEKRSGLMIKSKITIIYLLIALIVCILRLVVEMKLAGSEPTWNLYATCVIQGADCGLYVSMVMLLYCGYKHEEKDKGNTKSPKETCRLRKPGWECKAKRVVMF